MESDEAKAWAIVIIFILGMSILLAQALLLPLIIIGIILLLASIGFQHEGLLYLSIFCFIGAGICFVWGHVLGASPFGQIAVDFFNQSIKAGSEVSGALSNLPK